MIQPARHRRLEDRQRRQYFGWQSSHTLLHDVDLIHYPEISMGSHESGMARPLARCVFSSYSLKPYWGWGIVGAVLVKSQVQPTC